VKRQPPLPVVPAKHVAVTDAVVGTEDVLTLEYDFRLAVVERVPDNLGRYLMDLKRKDDHART